MFLDGPRSEPMQAPYAVGNETDLSPNMSEISEAQMSSLSTVSHTIRSQDNGSNPQSTIFQCAQLVDIRWEAAFHFHLLQLNRHHSSD